MIFPILGKKQTLNRYCPLIAKICTLIGTECGLNTFIRGLFCVLFCWYKGFSMKYWQKLKFCVLLRVLFWGDFYLVSFLSEAIFTDDRKNSEFLQMVYFEIDSSFFAHFHIIFSLIW